MSKSAVTWQELEAQLRKLVERGQLDEATGRFMTYYGGDILGFLLMRHHDEVTASEVFSQFCEDFWRGLPGFRWQSTLRSWGYTLARNASSRYFRTVRRQLAELPSSSQLPAPAADPRTSTALHLRSEVKVRMRELRRQLPMIEQTLLVLRIDKGLSWEELALVLEARELTPEERKRCAARLRQRFLTIKRHLKALAVAEGLI